MTQATSSPSTPPAAEPCDVLVIDGGPAGSTMAALLAGDIFGPAAIRNSLPEWRTTWGAGRARRHDVRDVGRMEGENVTGQAR